MHCEQHILNVILRLTTVSDMDVSNSNKKKNTDLMHRGWLIWLSLLYFLTPGFVLVFSILCSKWLNVKTILESHCL